MATAADVLSMLIPQGGWTSSGNDYESIEFLECEPITKAEFEAGISQFNELKIKQEANLVAAKETVKAKLAALGLDLDDLKALGL